jgi:perosamine synthetase
MKWLPVAGPSITSKEIDYVTDAVTNAWYADANTYVERFERAFATYLGRMHAVTLPSCTSGLHLALASLGLGPGDEVIVPDITWIATSAPISYVGATPVFADVDRESWCLTPETLEQVITPRSKAVIVVDVYGNMPDMAGVLEVARRHDIHVIEDAAEAVGSEYRGRMAGAFGTFGVFSFHGSKTLVTGEGGMLATDDEELFQRCLFLRDHGREPGDRHFFNREVAYKYKMSSLQAALGLAQLERVDELVERKRRLFDWYRQELGGIEGLELNREAPGTKASYWMVTAIVDAGYGLRKEDLLERFREAAIDTRPFFHPLSSLPAYAATEEARAASERNRVAYEISPRGINLPSALNLTRGDVERVAERFRELLQR